jgi:hypothetical protein
VARVSQASSFVAMMKPAHLRYCRDSPRFRVAESVAVRASPCPRKEASSIAEELTEEHRVMDDLD